MEIEKKVLIAIDLNFETGFVLSKAASFFRDASAKFYVVCLSEYILIGRPYSSVYCFNKLIAGIVPSYS